MILLTQLPILLFIGGTLDLLFGFNQTSAGFDTLLFLFFVVPILNLSWLIAEIRLAVKMSRPRNWLMSFLLPGIALFFFIESIAIDLYLLSQMRM